jgi:hypothetical protein
MAEKPAVLIIGGLGYIGRFLALHIQKGNLASEVRIVDKVLPQLAWLAPEFEEACSKDKFMQADASKERESLSRPPFWRSPMCFQALPTCMLTIPCSRISSAYIRPIERERMGLCIQLRRRNAIFSRRRGVQIAVPSSERSGRARGCQTGCQGFCRAEYRHGVQA